jgi:hypothetical protein
MGKANRSCANYLFSPTDYVQEANHLLKYPAILLLLIFLLSCCAAIGQAQVPADRVGTLEGYVVDEKTGEGVQGAGLTVQGTDIEIFSGSGGWYRIENIPEGTNYLSVDAPGYQDRTFQVVVTNGSTIRSDIKLGTGDEDGDKAPPASTVALISLLVLMGILGMILVGYFFYSRTGGRSDEDGEEEQSVVLDVELDLSDLEPEIEDEEGPDMIDEEESEETEVEQEVPVEEEDADDDESEDEPQLMDAPDVKSDPDEEPGDGIFKEE